MHVDLPRHRLRHAPSQARTRSSAGALERDRVGRPRHPRGRLGGGRMLDELEARAAGSSAWSATTTDPSCGAIARGRDRGGRRHPSRGRSRDGGQATGRERRMDAAFPDTDVLVFGHSHIPWDTVSPAGMRLLNPGSPTDRRSQPAGTFMTATADDGALQRCSARSDRPDVARLTAAAPAVAPVRRGPTLQSSAAASSRRW